LIRKTWVRWTLGILLALFVTVAPFVYYRISYTYQKRLRVVTPGRFYRSGCMTAVGLETTIKSLGIRTVINLMEESPDPILHPHYFARASVKESDVVTNTGARYVAMTVEYLPRNRAQFEKPETINRYLAILDEPKNYPVLIHCKAGLHRTGVLVALYRMEYEGWTKEQALAELRANGFGEFASSSANEYIQQYLLGYQPRSHRVVEQLPLPVTPGRFVSRPGTLLPGGYAPLPKD